MTRSYQRRQDAEFAGTRLRQFGRFVCLLVAVFALAMSGCGGGDGEQAGHAQGSPGGAGPRGPHGSGGRPTEPAIPVAVEEAHVGAIASYYTATATLAAEKEAEVLARVSGVVF